MAGGDAFPHCGLWFLLAAAYTISLCSVQGFGFLPLHTAKFHYLQGLSKQKSCTIGLQRKPCIAQSRLRLRSPLRAQADSVSSSDLPDFAQMAAIACERWDGMLARFNADGNVIAQKFLLRREADSWEKALC